MHVSSSKAPSEALPLTTHEDALKLERDQLKVRAANARDEAAKARFLDRVKQVEEQLKPRTAPPRGRTAVPTENA